MVNSRYRSTVRQIIRRETRWWWYNSRYAGARGEFTPDFSPRWDTRYALQQTVKDHVHVVPRQYLGVRMVLVVQRESQRTLLDGTGKVFID